VNPHSQRSSPPNGYGQPISDERQRLLQQRLDAWATDASHDLSGPFDSTALTGADVSWLVEWSGRATEGGASPLQLQGARLQGAHLERADLRDARLERANLYGAHLGEARLTGAHLEGASLEAADLQGADLADAQLDGANFNGARLQGTVLAGIESRPPVPLVKGSDSPGCFAISAFSVLGVLALLGLCVVTPALYLASSVGSELAMLVIGVSYGLGALAIIGAGRATLAGENRASRPDPGAPSGRRPALLALGSVSGSVVVVLSLGIIIWVSTLRECGGGAADVCGLFLFPSVLAFLFGLLVSIFAAIFTLVGAGRHKDWVSFTLVLAAELLGLGLCAYLLQVGGQLTNYPPYMTFGFGAIALILLCIPLAPLLQQWLRDRRWARYAALTSLVVAPLIVTLLVAPPWVASGGGAYREPVMQVTTDDAPADCAHGQYPPIVIKTAGGSTLYWTAHDDSGDGVRIVPTSGALGPGEQQTVLVSGVFTPSADDRGILITITQHTASDPTGDYGDTFAGWICANAP